MSQFTLAVYTFSFIVAVFAANIVGIGVIAAISWRDMQKLGARQPVPHTLRSALLR